MPQAKTGSTVLVHYTAMQKNGKVIESTAGGDPLRIIIGAGKVLRGFEEALVGMSAGESKRVTIPPDKAYGRRNPAAVSSLSRDTAAPIGKDAGQMQHEVVNRGTPDEFCITVSDKGLNLDNNPHLAGEEVVFEIDLIDIKDT